MQIDQLNQLLQLKYPHGHAQVSSNVHANRRTAVDVVFTPNGKVYTYRGYIYEIAEQLKLIDSSKDMHAAAQRIIKAFRTQLSVVDFAGASDTLRYMGVDVDSVDAGVDQYNRKLTTYTRIN